MERILYISENDLEKISFIIKENNLSAYNIDKDDFICYKEDGAVVGFGRICSIDSNNYELSSLWVHSDYRGKKLGIKIIQDLIENKFYTNNNLYIGCKIELLKYYESIGFKLVLNDFPEKFHETIKFAKELGITPIIMKLSNKN